MPLVVPSFKRLLPLLLLCCVLPVRSDSLPSSSLPSNSLHSSSLNNPSLPTTSDQQPLALIPPVEASLDTIPTTPDSEPKAIISSSIAIIIDDIGYHAGNGLRAVRLPGALTIAVLPFTPNGIALAEIAQQQGKEIMLHAPMSNIRGLPLDAGALTDKMGEHAFITALHRGLEAIPYISGVNNHMGSQLTQQSEPMRWLMRELKQRQLFFIDSRTSADSLAWDVAQRHHVPSLKRDVFLDNERNGAAIELQFRRLLKIARRTGNALAIGHPYPETLAFLEATLPLLEAQGVKLISVSEMLKRELITAKPNAI